MQKGNPLQELPGGAVLAMPKVKDAFHQIAAAAMNSTPPVWGDLTEEQRRELAPPAEAQYQPMAQENLPVSDPGIPGHATFELESPVVS